MAGDWNSTMPGFQTSVPQSLPAASGSNEMAQSLIKMIENPIDPNLIRQANTPIPGAHAATVPSSLTTPVSPYQERPLDQRQVVGRKNAGRQGVANAFTAATNALGTIVTKQAQIKQGQIRDAATKVITAQQAIDEAKIAHDQAIAAGDAEGASKYQQMIQQNQQARDAVFADPKMQKALQKGFNISYTDPGANKTEEHAAVQEALKNAKSMQEKRQLMQEQRQKQNQARGSAMGAAFEKSMPQGMAPNTLAQAQLSYVLQQRKEAVELNKAVQPALIRAEQSGDNSKRQQITELLKQANTISQQNFNRVENFKNRAALLGYSSRLATQRLYTQANLAYRKAVDLMNMKDADPLKVFQLANASARQWSAEQVSAQRAVSTAEYNLTTIANKKDGNPEYEAAKAEVKQAQDNLKMIQDQADQILNINNMTLHNLNMESIPGPNSEDGDGADSTDEQPGSGNFFTDFLGGITGTPNVSGGGGSSTSGSGEDGPINPKIRPSSRGGTSGNF